MSTIVRTTPASAGAERTRPPLNSGRFIGNGASVSYVRKISERTDDCSSRCGAVPGLFAHGQETAISHRFSNIISHLIAHFGGFPTRSYRVHDTR